MLMRILPFVAILLLFLATGCATTPQVVLQDGTPAPSSIYMERNLQTKMTAEAYVARITLEENDDGEKESKTEDYLPLGTGKLQKLPKDTYAVGGQVRILNPEKVPYTLFVIYGIDYEKEKWPYRVSRVLYMGNSERETIEVNRQLEEANPEVKLRVVIMEGEDENLKEEDILFEFTTTFIRKGG
ncbi:MAG: hypothetical protein ACLFNN_01180 [Candidatus Paceibacterota bacterium]